MTAYVTSNLKMSDKGGIGHVFNDVLTSYIIGEMYGLTTLHFPIKTDTFHGLDDWEEYFKWYVDQPLYSSYKKLQQMYFCEPPDNDGHSYFHYFSKCELDKIFDDPVDNAVYHATRSNRVLLTDVYVWESNKQLPTGTYSKLINTFKGKYRKIHPYQKHTDVTLITVHIRRGDQYCKGQEKYARYVLEYLQDNLTRPAEVRIFTNGNIIDAQDIAESFKGLKLPIALEMRKSTSSFKLIADADINIMGRSAFPKLAGLFSDKIKIYQPGYIGNKELRPKLGLEVEERDSDWVEVDINYDFDNKRLNALLEQFDL